MHIMTDRGWQPLTPKNCRPAGHTPTLGDKLKGARTADEWCQVIKDWRNGKIKEDKMWSEIGKVVRF